MATLNFDATVVAPATELQPLPNGDYKVAIMESEMKQSKTGGEYLALEYQVLDGEFKGRRLWQNLNLKNANATAVEIARAELSAICHAVGVMRPGDSSQLHNRPMMAKVICEPRKDTGEISNRIKGVKSLKDAQAAPAMAGVETAPW
jgi:hypothetical protein